MNSVDSTAGFCLIVDADACPQTVRRKIESICSEHKTDLVFVTDVNHELYPQYGKAITVDQGHDAVDMEIINRIKPGCLVITQDYGLASLVLAKGAHAMHPSGKVYDHNNIDFLLMDRHLAAKSRRAGERTSRNKKRSTRDDYDFGRQLEAFFQKHISDRKSLLDKNI
jgi:hypothetical protein